MSQYQSAYANPQGPGDARPTALQIVQDAGLENKLADKVAVITGAHAGIGLETTRSLLKTGLTIFATARDVSAAEMALSKLGHTNQIHVIEMDQTSFNSVRSAAKEILKRTTKISILINNAGIMAIPTLELTIDGYEKQLQTNHLAHFLFFHLLKPALLEASSPVFASRVINVSASAHRLQGINDGDNYSFQRGAYTPWNAYAQSKTANIYMANALDRKYALYGVHASSLHPGIIGETGLGKHVPTEQAEAIMNAPFVLKIRSNVEQGAATTVWAAVSPDWEGKGGKYLINCSEVGMGPDDGDITKLECVSHTYDEQKEERLWSDSMRIVGLSK